MMKISSCLSVVLVACLLVPKAESGPLPTLFGGDDAILNIGTLGNILKVPGSALADVTKGMTAFGGHMTGMLADTLDSTGGQIRRFMSGLGEATDLSNIFGPAAPAAALAAPPLAARDAPPAEEPSKEAERSAA